MKRYTYFNMLFFTFIKIKTFFIFIVLSFCEISTHTIGLLFLLELFIHKLSLPFMILPLFHVYF